MRFYLLVQKQVKALYLCRNAGTAKAGCYWFDENGLHQKISILANFPFKMQPNGLDLIINNSHYTLINYHSLRAHIFSYLHALITLQTETGVADQTAIVFPLHAVLKFAASLHQIILFFAGSTLIFGGLNASLDIADSSFEFIVSQAFNAGASIVLETSRLHGPTAAVLVNEVSAFAGEAAKVIVGFAVGDHTLVVFEFEGFEAVRTGVVSLLRFAP